jgi:hypothetical protein
MSYFLIGEFEPHPDSSLLTLAINEHNELSGIVDHGAAIDLYGKNKTDLIGRANIIVGALNENVLPAPGSRFAHHKEDIVIIVTGAANLVPGSPDVPSIIYKDDNDQFFTASLTDFHDTYVYTPF